MKGKWISRLASINKELLLVLSIIAAAAAVNFLVAGQRLVLSFYNLPTLLAAYYFGRRHAVAAAVASVLFVVWMNLMNPLVLGGSVEPGQRLCVSGNFVGQKFEANETVQPCILGLVNHPHAPAAQFLDNEVVRNGLVDHWRRIRL